MKPNRELALNSRPNRELAPSIRPNKKLVLSTRPNKDLATKLIRRVSTQISFRKLKDF